MFGGNSRGRKSSGPDRKDDIKDFQDNLRDKDIDKTNYEEIYKEYRSMKNSVNTALTGIYEDIERIQDNIDEKVDQEQYKDDGWIREKTFELSRESEDLMKKCIEWLILDRRTQDILLDKQHELIGELVGKQLSKEVLEEVKGVLSEQNQADRAKIEILKDSIEDYQENIDKKVDRKIQRMESEVRETEREVNNKIDKINDIVAAMESHTGETIGKMEKLSQNLEEEEVEEVEQTAPPSVDEEFEKIEEETESFEEETTEDINEEDVDKLEPGEQIEVPESWNMDDTSTAFYDTVPENPRYGYTQIYRPVTTEVVKRREWMVLHALDSGCETKDEIQEHCDNNFGGFPNGQVRKLLQHEIIDEEEIPEEIANLI